MVLGIFFSCLGANKHPGRQRREAFAEPELLEQRIGAVDAQFLESLGNAHFNDLAQARPEVPE